MQGKGPQAVGPSDQALPPVPVNSVALDFALTVKISARKGSRYRELAAQLDTIKRDRHCVTQSSHLSLLMLK
jgi:hypothetical protein